MNETQKQLKKSSRDLARARKKADQVWESHVLAIQEAHRDGMSCAAIGRLTGVSKARIWQLVKREEKDQDASGELARRQTSQDQT